MRKRVHFLPSRMMPNPNSRTEIGARLVLTRKALDYTQATMAGLMGVDGQTLAAYEAGRRRIPMKQGHPARLGLPGKWQTAPAHPREFASSQAQSGEGTKVGRRCW